MKVKTIKYRGFKINVCFNAIEKILGKAIGDTYYSINYYGEAYDFYDLNELKKWLDIELGIIPIVLEPDLLD